MTITPSYATIMDFIVLNMLYTYAIIACLELNRMTTENLMHLIPDFQERSKSRRNRVET